MKRVPILSLLLTVSILAGFLILFPIESVLLLVTLVALVTAQVVIVRQHLHAVGNSGSRRQGAVDLGKVARESPAPRVSAIAAVEDSSSKDEAPPLFDPAVFSRFRAHLDAAEGDPKAPLAPPVEAKGHNGGNSSGTASEPPARASTGKDAAGVDDDVRVVLSPAARSMAAAAKKGAEESAATPSEAVEAAAEEGEDLFADLRTQPLEQEGKKSKAAKKPQSGRGKTAGKKARPELDSEADAKQGEPAAKSKDSGEQEMLLKLAEDALEKGDRAGAAAGMEDVLRLHDEAQQPLPWRVRLAVARLAVLEGDHSRAVAEFEQLLKWRPRFEESEYVAQIDQLTSPVSGANGADLKVSMLLKLLAVFRQSSDRTAMDRIYVLIEGAQEQSGDEQKLIQYYKNHLEIKTVLEDVDGQLGLIDQIGNRYYKLGDTEAARKFYEQGLKLREAQEASAEEAGMASP